MTRSACAACRGTRRSPATDSNFGLSPAQDAALTLWMRERLRLAVWAKPSDCACALAEIEAALLAELEPPLNLQGILTPWTPGPFFIVVMAWRPPAGG